MSEVKLSKTRYRRLILYVGKEDAPVVKRVVQLAGASKTSLSKTLRALIRSGLEVMGHAPRV